MATGLTAELLALADSLGAASAGVAAADPFGAELQAISRANATGRAGPLGFTYDDPVLSTDLRMSFPWVERIVVITWDYLPTAMSPAQTGAIVGRFATANHYEGVSRVIEPLAAHLRSRGYQAVSLMDDSRLVDRAAAVRAGAGWSGKSTMVLAPGHGPWLLIGSVVTDAPLETTEPMKRGCGTCVACIPACPTGALGEQGLDARRCLSTWLQTPGSIPHWVRPLLGNRIYGCDDCLTSCPPGGPALDRSGGSIDELGFGDLLALSDDDLLARFDWWFVPRRDGRYLRRNLLVAAGNSSEATARASVLRHLDHPSSMIRGHAYWALAVGYRDRDMLRDRLDRETVTAAYDELVLALLSVESPDRHRGLLSADEWARGAAGIRGLALIGDPTVAETLEILVVHRGPRPAMPDIGLEIRFAPVGADIEETMVAIYDPDLIIETTQNRQKTRHRMMSRR
jgi:epoxyqueuosine reductase